MEIKFISKDLTNKNYILVTGGAGYIGSIAVELLLKNNYEVIVLDNLSTGHKDSLFKEAIFYNSVIGDKDTLTKIFTEHKISAVMHFAGAALVEESVKNPMKYFDINVCQAKSLLDAIVQFKVNNIIFSSTCAVYGMPPHECIPMSEDLTRKPISPYGESKLIFEELLKWYKQIYKLNYIALRYFNVAGASLQRGENHNPETHLIPLVIKAAKDKNQVLKIYGTDYSTKDGTAIRDYIHVVDLIEAHINALNAILNDIKHSNIYNVGYGHGFSVLEIVNASKKVLNTEINYEECARRHGDPPVLIANPSKIKEELNWTPKLDNIYRIIESASKFL